MTKVTARIPSGFAEYLPADQIEFNRLLGIIRSTYEKYGFAPLDTPVMELRDVLLAKGGGETEQQVYELRRGDTDLVLRYDLTVPLARYVAQHENELTFPFRRYHIGKVYRGERAQAGRFREFYQCDIDVIGSNSPIVDAEFPAIINEIFEQFGFGEFTIRLNNRRVLNGFFESLGLADSATEVLRVVDKMEKISADEFVTELKTLGLDQDQIDRLLGFVAIKGTNQEIIDQLNALQLTSPAFQQGLQELTMLVDALRTMGVPERRFQVDLRIARGLGYYTGTVYETMLNDYPQVGSVCSGGRYDDLAGYYTKTELPGVGISIGLTRLFYQLRQAGIIQSGRQSLAQVMVVPMAEAQIQEAVATAALLRQADIPVMLYTELTKMKKTMSYADRMGFPYVVIIGEQESQAGQVLVQNLSERTRTTVARADVVSAITGSAS